MRRELRTAKQIEADRLDLEVFRVAEMLDRFADTYGEAEVRDMSKVISALRPTIRQHMHNKDWRETR